MATIPVAGFGVALAAFFQRFVVAGSAACIRLLVGLVVSVFQAATQINEQTLSFLPRLLATLLAVMAAGPWIVGQLMDFFNRLFAQIPALLG